MLLYAIYRVVSETQGLGKLHRMIQLWYSLSFMESDKKSRSWILILLSLLGYPAYFAQHEIFCYNRKTDETKGRESYLYSKIVRFNGKLNCFNNWLFSSGSTYASPFPTFSSHIESKHVESSTVRTEITSGRERFCLSTQDEFSKSRMISKYI